MWGRPKQENRAGIHSQGAKHPAGRYRQRSLFLSNKSGKEEVKAWEREDGGLANVPPSKDCGVVCVFGMWAGAWTGVWVGEGLECPSI